MATTPETENIVEIKSGSIGPGGVKTNQKDFYMALANQEQHADLDPPENRKNSNTRFKRPWRW